jgi:peptidoglycan/xylan/chitin deacetylase (PgdA/CDA1 family)
VPRLLRLLDHHRVPATFFVPAVSALLHPEEIPACVAAGHEIALHGWIHEWNTVLDRATERDLLLRSIAVLERLGGSRPTGIRTPSWDFSDHTLDLIREAQLTYDSSLMADDEPYELLAAGEATGIVEIPVEWIRDDAPYLTMDRYSGVRPYTPPRQLVQIWIDEFDQARQQRGLFQLTMHPHLIGHRSRIVVLEQLLEHITAAGGVWFATHNEVARTVAASLGRRTSAL